jgi:hypothetical protein
VGTFVKRKHVAPREAALLKESASSSGTDINRKPINYSGTVALGSHVIDIFGTDHLNPLPQPILTVLAILIAPNPLRTGARGT